MWCRLRYFSTYNDASGKRIKTDRRDAENIARCLAFNLYGPVRVPTTEDDAVEEYIRMRKGSLSVSR